MSTAYLGLGSNLGDRESNLTKALELLTQKVAIKQVSSIYETEPVGFVEQRWFLNMVCCCTTQLSPFELLSFAKAIEAQLGRDSSSPDMPRPMDIDILFCDDQVIETEALAIPHPRIGERAFVLIPLVEIAPEILHPVGAKSMRHLLSELTDSHKVRKRENVPSIGSAAL